MNSDDKINQQIVEFPPFSGVYSPKPSEELALNEVKDLPPQG
jgi:hypothetical protein